MQLRLYNTLSGAVEPVEFQPDEFTTYVCGPTVYDNPHIGNARPPIVFNALMRLIKSIAPKGLPIVHLMNITDIDDKIILRAEELGISITELTRDKTRIYLEQLRGLELDLPTHMPRVTDSIPEIIRMIEKLIGDQFAYVVDQHVLFDVTRGNAIFQRGDGASDHSRIGETTYKRNSGDFVLWKPEWKGVGWDSPWGRGRPGWHIECSALIHEHLGKTIDIHGGGQDLIFPHHEAECQQSHAVTGQPLARHWMHIGMVMIDGRKMSKSDGNFITIDEVLSRPQGSEALRMAMLMSHYRHPFDFTKQRINDAQTFLNGIMDKASGDDQGIDKIFLNALLNDFNTPLAIQRLSSMDRGCIASSMELLGFRMQDKGVLEPELQAILDERVQARMDKDWELSDLLRKELAILGIIVEDTGNTTHWRRTREAVYP